MTYPTLLASAFLFLLATLYSAFAAESRGQLERPDDSRFEVVTVIDRDVLDEPMAFEVLRDGTVYVAERKGVIRRYDPVSGATLRVDSLVVNTRYVNAAAVSREAEEGLVGFTLDPDFEENHWAYFLYAHPTVAKHVLSRMELRGNDLLQDTEVVLLEFDVQRETCCHTGGGMTWDVDGNLYVTVGNSTGNTQTSQTDQRAGRMNWDDQRGAANTNDLRGKILRIRPQPDGTYTIPEGNLFPSGTPLTRPEIYAMGLRNPWRVSVDSRTGFVYWGEVGADAAQSMEDRAQGFDELNQARRPGFFGWPYFNGPNEAFPITDYETGEILPPKDPEQPINDSRWNTGLRELPPAQPAFISYPFALSEEFPEVGSGARSATGGPIYRRADFDNPARPWPAYFEGKWLATDFARGWIMSITMDEYGDYVSMERIVEDYRPIGAMDIKFGPDGDLYLLEYGSVWFGRSPDSRLVRIEYNAGNRAPSVEITSDTRGGAVPFSVNLSAEGTYDPDGDALTYEWRVEPVAGGQAQTFDTPDATVSFAETGVYTATLTVRDPEGATSSESLRIVAGNEPPAIAVDVLSGANQTFFFPDRPLEYAVQVSDREDGTVDPGRVALSFDYVPEDFDASVLRQGDDPVNATTRFAVARTLTEAAGCNVCHLVDGPSLGPSFHAIAERYQGQPDATSRLITSIREGSTGEWDAAVAMPAHSALSVDEAAAMARYIMESRSTAINERPLSGSYTPALPEGDPGRGSLVVRAVYTDQGADGLPAQTSERLVMFRGPVLIAGSAEVISGASTNYLRGPGLTAVSPTNAGHIGFQQLDLTGIGEIEFAASMSGRDGTAGGEVEIRLDSPTGARIGGVEVASAGSVRTGIEPVDGVRDLYLVFTNPAAPAVEPLFTLSTIRLIPLN